MSRFLVTILAVTVFCGVAGSVPSFAQPSAAPTINQLFLSDDPLQITIEADMDQLLKDRSQESEYRPAQFSYISETGDSLSYEAQVKTRGNFRLKRAHCDFPPIKLNLKKNEMAGTAFEGQDKFKLVTHCQNKRGSYEEYALQEYLIYRTYNLLTDASFQVRLVHATYVDAAGKKKPITKYGFLIEDDDMMAARLNATLVDQIGITQQIPSAREMMMVAVFQYLIGNTDWSVPALHNIKLLRQSDRSVLLPVPYDFDFSGVINTRYSTPDPKLGIESVEERMYRGICRSESEIEPVLDIFREKKDEIYALWEDFPHLKGKLGKRSLDYFDAFYSTINNHRSVKAEFEDRCAKTP